MNSGETHQSKGMEINRQRIKLQNRKRKDKLTVKITDLKSKESSGTLIQLNLPEIYM